ncbi:MAG: glycosyltransferase family 2 protein [Dethiobacteria bacterium]|nr:glycosyltransferase family 2 protein [Bacillota bacterium]
MSISALIPAYNEEETIYVTVTSLKAIKEIEEIIVIDDASTDRTSEVAFSAGAQVVRHQHNSGKGEAVWTGLKYASGEILIFADADLGESAKEFEKLIIPVRKGEADMVVAKFPPGKVKGGLGFAKSLAFWGIWFYTGFKSQSPLSGQRVFLRKIVDNASHVPRGFGLEVFLTVSCLQQGHRLLELPVEMHHRETGRDLASFKHRAKQFYHIACELWRLNKSRKEKRKC